MGGAQGLVRRQLTEELFGTDPEGMATARQAIHRAIGDRWIEIRDDRVYLVGALATPDLPEAFLASLSATPPGEFFAHAELTSTWTAPARVLANHWVATQYAHVTDSLIRVVASAEDPDDAALAPHRRHLERWLPNDARVRRWWNRRARSRTPKPVTLMTGIREWPYVPPQGLADAIHTHLHDLTVSGPHIAIVRGNAGIGKSAFLEHLIADEQRGSAQPAVVVQIAGDWVPEEHVGSAWVHSRARGRFINALLEHAAVAASASGQWMQRVLRGGAETDESVSRTVWRENVRAAWRELLAAHGEHVWLVVDDVQWLDEDMMLLLTALLTLHTTARWKCVAATRDGIPPLWRTLEREAPARWYERDVPTLSDDAIAPVAAATAIPVPLLTEALHYAEGHPFRWRELVRQALEDGHVPNERTLTDLLVKERATWSRRELRTAVVVLLLAEHATWELVAQTLEITPTEAEEIARPLRHRGVLGPEPERRTPRAWVAAGRWRDVILSAVPMDERRMLHRAVAMTLEHSLLLADRPEVQLQAIDHHRQAGDFETALRRMPDVASAAVRAGSVLAANTTWTELLRDIIAVGGDAPTTARRDWANFRIRHEIFLAERLPPSSRTGQTVEEEILTLWNPEGSALERAASIRSLRRVALNPALDEDVRLRVLRHAMRLTELLPMRVATPMRHELVHDLVPYQAQLPQALRWWYAFHANDRQTLAMLQAQPPMVDGIASRLNVLRLLGYLEEAWRDGMSVWANADVPSYTRYHLIGGLGLLAENQGDMAAYAEAEARQRRLRQGVTDPTLGLTGITFQQNLMFVVAGLHPWTPDLRRQVDEFWRLLRAQPEIASNADTMTAAVAAYGAARDGALGSARGWLHLIHARVPNDELVRIAEVEAPNALWRYLATLYLTGDCDRADMVRGMVRHAAPSVRESQLRGPVYIARALCAYFACQANDLWGATTLTPVRSWHEAEAIARAASPDLQRAVAPFPPEPRSRPTIPARLRESPGRPYFHRVEQSQS